MSVETFSFVEKLWEGIEPVMERSREGKKSFQELKSRLEGMSSVEKDNGSNYQSFAKKFVPLVEGGSISTIYQELADLFALMSTNFKGISEKITSIPSQIVSDLDLYTTTFEKNVQDLPAVKKKKEKAVDLAQQMRNKYIVAFREWDKVDDDYLESAKDSKMSQKKLDKMKSKADEKKAERDKAWLKYEEAVKECRKAEEAYNQQMTSFLTTCQKADQKRLKYISKTLSDACILYEEAFTSHLHIMTKIRTDLDQLDITKELDDYAMKKNTRRVPQPLTMAVEELKRSEKKNTAQRPTVAYAPFSNQKPMAPASQLPSVSAQHPLIVYSTYDYKPTFPPYNPNKPQTDKNNTPLPPGYSDIPLKGNNPYFLTKVDYPWDSWCEVASLIFQDEAQTLLCEGGDRGCAPTNYFNSEYYEYARNHLLSNPDAPLGAFQKVTPSSSSSGLMNTSRRDGGGGGEESVPPPPPLVANGGGGGGKKKTYSVLYTYKDEEGTLCVNTGETVYVPDGHTPEKSGEEWLLVETSDGIKGYIPANYVSRNF